MVDVEATLPPVAVRDAKPGHAVIPRAGGLAVLSRHTQVVYGAGVHAADDDFGLTEALDVPDAADLEHDGRTGLRVRAHVEEADGAVTPARQEARVGRRVRGQAVDCKDICAQVSYSPLRALSTVSLSECDAFFQAVEDGLLVGGAGH